MRAPSLTHFLTADRPPHLPFPLGLSSSPLGAVVSRLASELPEAGDTEMRKNLDDLLDHVQALKEQTQSLVRACVRASVLAAWNTHAPTSASADKPPSPEC
jgi:hypothetical protein